MAWRTGRVRRSHQEKCQVILALLSDGRAWSAGELSRPLGTKVGNLYSTLWNMVWRGEIVVDDQFKFTLTERGKWQTATRT